MRSLWLRKAIKLQYLRQFEFYITWQLFADDYSDPVMIILGVWYRFFVTNKNPSLCKVLRFDSKTSGDAKVPVALAFVYYWLKIHQ